MRRFLLWCTAVLLLLPGSVHAWEKSCPVYVRYSSAVTVDAGTVGDATVLCDAGDFATGGGDSTSASAGTPPSMWVSDSFSTDADGLATPDGGAPHGWHVFVYNSTADALALEATVVCVCAAAFVPAMPVCAPYVDPPAVPTPRLKLP